MFLKISQIPSTIQTHFLQFKKCRLKKMLENSTMFSTIGNGGGGNFNTVVVIPNIALPHHLPRLDHTLRFFLLTFSKI